MEITDIQNERGNVIRSPIGLKSITGVHYEKLYADTFNNLDEVANILKSANY